MKQILSESVTYHSTTQLALVSLISNISKKKQSKIFPNKYIFKLNLFIKNPITWRKLIQPGSVNKFSF